MSPWLADGARLVVIAVAGVCLWALWSYIWNNRHY
jgi:hypothetical protein